MKRLGLILVLLCAGAVPATAQIPDEFTNLKILPEKIGKRELVSTMRQFSQALGVRCNHCHKGSDDLEGLDFASDELEPKRVARAMMRMTREINDKLLPTTGRDSLIRVRCVTCHRGLERPEQLDDVLDAVVESEGVQAALARYMELRDQYYGEGSYDFGAGTLNGLADRLTREKGDTDGALEVLQLNVELHPDAVNSHVMLGRVHLLQGDRKAALASLQRALELDPDNEYAKRTLESVETEE